jgi:hypothetical protein
MDVMEGKPTGLDQGFWLIKIMFPHCAKVVNPSEGALGGWEETRLPI